MTPAAHHQAGAPAHDPTGGVRVITPADAITAADRQAMARLLRGEAVPAHILQLIAGPIGRAVAAADYAAHALGPATLAAYAADWGHFRDWCRDGGTAPLPAHPVIVAAYLASLGETRRYQAVSGRARATPGNLGRTRYGGLLGFASFPKIR